MKRNSKYRLLTLALVFFCLGAAGCQKKEEKGPQLLPGSSITPFAQKETNAQNKKGDEIVITAVLTRQESDDKTLVVADIDDGNLYALQYTGATDIRDQYDTVIAASQLKQGKIYEITCSAKGKASRIIQSAKTWENKGIERFTLNKEEGTFTVGSSIYKLAETTVYLSGGETVLPEEIVEGDQLSICGRDKTVYSITVEKGHGYIQLTGIDAFLDGYITINGKKVLPVTLNMVVTAPEGTYDLHLQRGNLSASRTVTVARNETLTEDFGEYERESLASGTIKLNITPENAVLTVDGKVKNHKELFNLTYGTHTIVIRAAGYETYSGRIVVGSSYFNEEISLAPEASASSQSPSETDRTSGYYIRITEPVGASVYVDSVYAGVIPVSIPKTSGKKVITLMKKGHVSKSYTLNINNASGDASYAFPELE